MSLPTTIWEKETAPSLPSIWATDNYPWLMSLPWQYGFNTTVWSKEY